MSFQFFDCWCPPCRGPVLSPDEIMAVKVLIAKLENAVAQIMLGQQVKVLVDQNGERLEFAGVTLPQLKAYIEVQKAKLPGYCAAASVARPMRFFF